MAKLTELQGERNLFCMLDRITGEALWKAFWDRNGWTDDRSPFAAQAEAIRRMWDAIAADARALAQQER